MHSQVTSLQFCGGSVFVWPAVTFESAAGDRAVQINVFTPSLQSTNVYILCHCCEIRKDVTCLAAIPSSDVEPLLTVFI